MENKGNIISVLDKTDKVKKIIANPELKTIIAGHWITIINIEIKCIIKVIKSLENRRTFVTRNYWKNYLSKVGLLNFFSPLMNAGYQ